MATTSIAPNDANIIYSPGNWLIAAAGASTINAGAYCRMMLTGTKTLSLGFTLPTTQDTTIPVLTVIVDGVAADYPLAASISVTLPSFSAAATQHYVELIVKNTPSYQATNLWIPQLSMVTLSGITVDSGGATQALAVRSKQILILSQSVSIGFRSQGDTNVDSADNNARYGWAYLQRDYLDAEVGVVGFSGQGLSIAGNGNVPDLLTTYNLLWSGQARSFATNPDMIVVADADNDIAAYASKGTASGSPANVQANLTTLADNLKAASPASKIVLMTPFTPYEFASVPAATITEYVSGFEAAALATGATFVNALACQSATDPTSDGLHPLASVQLGKCGPAVASLLRPVLYPAGSGRSYVFS